jgi:CheY-like chemotaxis protein
MNKLILIAEDELKTLKMIRNLLLYNGYPLMVARTGEAALRAALECKPDLILVDLHEPGLDGLEVARILKKDVATRKIPLLALGMSPLKWNAPRSRRSLCDGLAAKPLDLPSLLETIRRFLPSKPAHAAAHNPLSAGKRPFSHMTTPPA